MEALRAPLFIGNTLLELASVPSTNRYLADLISKNRPKEGTVIFAHTQTDGRGQFGKKWLSAPDQNLHVSILLQPDFLNLDAQFSLIQAVSLGVRDAIQSLTSLDIRVKWPNDLICRGKKIGGILIENSILGQSIQHSIIGIGINVNQKSFPSEISHAASLCNLSGRDFDPSELLALLCSGIEERYLRLRAGQAVDLHEEYKTSLYGRHQMVNLREAEEPFQAIVTDVTQDGELVVQTEQSTRRFRFHEVRWDL